MTKSKCSQRPRLLVFIIQCVCTCVCACVCVCGCVCVWVGGCVHVCVISYLTRASSSSSGAPHEFFNSKYLFGVSGVFIAVNFYNLQVVVLLLGQTKVVEIVSPFLTKPMLL